MHNSWILPQASGTVTIEARPGLALNMDGERLNAMSTHRQKPALPRKEPEAANKKAIIWAGASFGVVVIAVVLVLIFWG